MVLDILVSFIIDRKIIFRSLRLFFDTQDELPHGFLNFVLLSEEGRRGSDLCINRIKQALGVD